MIRWKKSSKFLYLEPNQTRKELHSRKDRDSVTTWKTCCSVSLTVNMAPNKSVTRASQEDAAFVWF